MKIDERGDFVFEPGDLVEPKDEWVNEWKKSFDFNHRKGFAIILGRAIYNFSNVECSKGIDVKDTDILYDIFWQETAQYDKMCAYRFKEFRK